MVAPTTLCIHDKTSLGAPNRRFAIPQADWHLSLGVGHNEHLLHHRCGGSDHSSRRFLGSASIGEKLARRDEAMDNLLASWDTVEPVKTDGLGACSRSTNLLLGEPAIGRHRDEKAVRRKSRTAFSCR